MQLSQTRNNILAFALLIALLGLCSRSEAQQTGENTGTLEQSFFDAIKAGNSSRVAELLAARPYLIRATYRSGISSILYAVYTDHRDIAELLVGTGVELNVFEAAATGKLDRVRRLVKKDPTLVRAWSSDGWTALHLNFGHIDVAKFLLKAGADVGVNSRNKLNATPLQGAIVMNRIDLARLYISHGADVNCRSENGISPLGEAAANGFLDLAKLLLAHGANVNQRDDGGKTPLALALEYKKPDLEKLIREHGGTL